MLAPAVAPAGAPGNQKALDRLAGDLGRLPLRRSRGSFWSEGGGSSHGANSTPSWGNVASLAMLSLEPDGARPWAVRSIAGATTRPEGRTGARRIAGRWVPSPALRQSREREHGPTPPPDADSVGWKAVLSPLSSTLGVVDLSGSSGRRSGRSRLDLHERPGQLHERCERRQGRRWQQRIHFRRCCGSRSGGHGHVRIGRPAPSPDHRLRIRRV